MIEVQEQNHLIIIVDNDRIDLFKSAMAKLYQETNRIGFHFRILDKDEQDIFNEVTEELALLNNG